MVYVIAAGSSRDQIPHKSGLDGYHDEGWVQAGLILSWDPHQMGRSEAKHEERQLETSWDGGGPKGPHYPKCSSVTNPLP